MFETQAGTLQKKERLNFDICDTLDEILSDINQVHREKFYVISFTCGKSGKICPKCTYTKWTQ